VEDARTATGRPTIGQVTGITIEGRHFSVAQIFQWERMPERIYTASLGEWSLTRRYVDDDAELTSEALPFYEQRHHHLHRNGRLDVTGYSPLDMDEQNARMQQFDPHGTLIAEGTIDPAGNAAIQAANFESQTGSARSRMLALGLTGKQFDPDTKLYYFGYRWYSPELMRWTQVEPLGLDGPNLWHYVGGNPIGWIDVLGLWKLLLVGSDPGSDSYKAGFQFAHDNGFIPVAINTKSNIPKILEEHIANNQGKRPEDAGMWGHGSPGHIVVYDPSGSPHDMNIDPTPPDPSEIPFPKIPPHLAPTVNWFFYSCGTGEGTPEQAYERGKFISEQMGGQVTVVMFVGNVNYNIPDIDQDGNPLPCDYKCNGVVRDKPPNDNDPEKRSYVPGRKDLKITPIP